MVPVHKLPLTFLEDVDKLIRSAVKEMLLLPSDEPNSMLYSAKQFRGLGLVRASWEGFLQNCNPFINLSLADNTYVNSVRSLIAQLQSSCKQPEMVFPSEL